MEMLNTKISIMKTNLFYVYKLSFILALSLIYSCKQPSAASAGDEATIRKMMTEEMTAAWEKSDKSWIEANYLEDADIAFPSGPLFSGRKNLPVSGGMVPTGRKFNIEIESLRFISPDVAIVNNNAQSVWVLMEEI